MGTKATNYLNIKTYDGKLIPIASFEPHSKDDLPTYIINILFKADKEMCKVELSKPSIYTTYEIYGSLHDGFPVVLYVTEAGKELLCGNGRGLIRKDTKFIMGVKVVTGYSQRIGRRKPRGRLELYADAVTLTRPLFCYEPFLRKWEDMHELRKS